MTPDKILDELTKRGISDPQFFGGGTKGDYQILQNPVEFASFISWCQINFPKGIENYLEIGTATGGNIRTVYELVGFTRAFSIDLNAEGMPESQKRNLGAIPKGIHTLWKGNSHTMEAHVALRNYGQRFDVAFIDGDHFGPGVQMDIELALGYMKPKGYLAFHDVDNDHWTGVRDAIRSKSGYLHKFAHLSDQKKFGIAIFEVIDPSLWPSI